jgi:hypothetical protein
MRDLKNVEALSLEERCRREIPPLGATDAEVHALHSVSLRESEALRENLHSLKTYCTFIGYPRSGHSILGSLLDAHPNAVIAHELDTVRFVEAGFSAMQLYYLLLENSRQFTNAGRTWGKYCYAVRDQWQGRYSELEIIGDNKGGRTTVRIGRDWELLERLCRTIPLQHRFVHVIRNPFDNIATIALRQTHDLRRAIEQYFFMCGTNRKIREQLGDQVFDLYHEDFVGDPRYWLGRLCDFVGVSATLPYLDACADIVYRLPHRSRLEVQWPPGTLDLVAAEKDKYAFLRRYRPDD